MASNTQTHKKIRVGIFFGGASAEHEVSLQSARNVLEALDPQQFEPILIGISKTGSWHSQALPKRLTNGRLAELSASANTSALTLLPGTGTLIDSHANQPIATIDVAFPVLHGPLGEDGAIQGFFELAQLPYVGPGVLGSAVGMDKDVMKRLLRDAGIPITPFHVFTTADQHTIDATAIFAALGTPVFVKPANMGSSVGVHKARTAKELQEATAIAFRYDTKIIIEKAIEGDEIECAVLGNEHPVASVIGQIIPRSSDFYSYEAKYIDKKGATLEIPASLSKETSQKARQLALQTFHVLNCQGMGRVDMFVTKNDQILVNEINTIPGFTAISMYPKLWKASGIAYPDLITRLIELAIERHNHQRQN